MKSKDIYFVTIGGLHIFIFFEFLKLAEQLISVRSVPNKQVFITVFGLFISLTIFFLFNNLAKLINILPIKEEEVHVKVVPIAQGTVVLLSLLLISTLLKNFILFN